ncbi:4Fe-4S binding protein [Geotalea sp. SG265]|uniref:4Fe-4S binding protein n=1 Tax=Geotalea sp. SG265 TaxID=2922867 RepID=UPI001FB00F09|nr:4Fe-4S binding protein [Geotalea sp. SG265]
MQKQVKVVTRLRSIVQWAFFIWTVGIGIRFAMFITSAERGTSVPLVSRPPGVEGFLPIGALTSLKYWLVSGQIHPVHPAALVIFLAILAMSLVAKKSFCSWLCPVGTISEFAHKLGVKIFGCNFHVWGWLDIPLRGIKYLLLFFFVKIILIDMPGEAVGGFLDAPYWAVSDVKMLHFFTRMSLTTMAILGILIALSLLFKNFWCRYLCPYGALLGLISLLSPFKIRREAEGCTACRRCTAACPSGLAVHSATAVSSPECTGCLTCTAACPERHVLAMQPAFRKRPLSVWVYPAVVLFVFFGGIGVGIVSDHWQSSLTFADYQRLLPLVQQLSH